MVLTKKRASSLVASFAISLSLLAVTSPAQGASPTAPPSGLEVVTTNTAPRLTWDEVEGASGYRVQLSSSPDFSSILEDTSITARTYAPRQYYENATGRAIYWRVAAFTDVYYTPAGMTAWTVGNTLNLDAKAGPSSLSPVDNKTFAYPEPVTLSWATLPGASMYEIQYVVGGDFGSAATISQTTTATEFTPTNQLISGNWTWRVRAKLANFGENNYSVWSTPQSFKVEWKQADSQVNLLAPVATSSNTAAITDPVFKWEPVTGASYYKITVARDFAMTNTLIPATTVYGTTYVPTGNLLNGEYYWTVTAFDSAGNPGYTPEDPQRFIRRWGPQAGPDQPASNGPNGIEAAPQPLANMGSTTWPTATSMQWNKFELEWEPVARASKYTVTVKSINIPEAKAYSCTTPNTSVTSVEGYYGGAQSPGLFRGQGTCFEYLPRFGLDETGNKTPIIYQWRVQATDDSASGEKYGQGDVISAESTPLYFKFTCDDATTCGGIDEPVVQLDPSNTWATQGGDNDLTTAPAPVMEWAAYKDEDCSNSSVPQRYEVRVYRGTGISVHIATFFTSSTKIRPNGIFKDDNTSQSYYWRVRPICGNNVYPNIESWDQLPAKSWTRTTTPTSIPASYQEEANGSILLRWTPQLSTGPREGSTPGYQLQYRPAGTANWSAINLEYPFWIPNTYGQPLANGNYEFRVASLDANYDVGRWSTVKDFTIVPTAPTGVQTEASSSSQFVVKWTPSPVADSYQVRYQKVGASDWTTEGLTEQTRYVVPNLTPGSYNVSVRSLHAGQNWSSWSASTSVTLAPKTVVALTPDKAVLDPDSRMLQWAPVAGASRYLVSFGNSANEALNDPGVEVVKPLFTITNDVRYGKAYYWRVTAVAEAQWPRVTTGSSAVQEVYFSTTPFEPTITNVSVIDRDIRVNWTPLTGDLAGDASTLQYRVRYRELNQVPEADWKYTTFTSGAASSLTVSNLTKGTYYEFQVGARNSNGTGRWSGSVNASTAKAPDAPANLTTKAVTDTTLRVGWDVPATGGSPILGYRIRYAVSGNTNWTTQTVGSDASEYEIKGLSKRTSYAVEIVAFNAVGESPSASYLASTIAMPSAPRSLTAVSKDAIVDLRWQPPADSGVSVIRDYVVEIQSYSNGTWGAWAYYTTTSTTNATVNIANGAKVRFRVLARNNEGSSPYSNTVESTVGMPGTFKIKLANVKGKLKVTWTKAAAPSSMPITHYRFQYSLNGKTWKTLKTVKATTPNIVSKVGKKKKYIYVRGYAKNGAGYGPVTAVAKIKRK